MLKYGSAGEANKRIRLKIVFDKRKHVLNPSLVKASAKLFLKLRLLERNTLNSRAKDRKETKKRIRNKK
jgi:hypothetical protein